MLNGPSRLRIHHKRPIGRCILLMPENFSPIMKSNLTILRHFSLLMCLLLMGESKAQNVGIGAPSPDHKLHISSNTSALLRMDNTTSLNTGVMSELHFRTGTLYTGAIKTIGNGTVTARLAFFTYATNSSSALLERMSILDNGFVGIGVNNPGFLLDVNGRMRLRHGGGTSGIILMDDANSVNRGFVGMKDNNSIGFFGYNGGGWGLTMSTTSGDVHIPARLSASSSAYNTASFVNFSGEEDFAAVEADARFVASRGRGILAKAGGTGVYCIADMAGSGHRYGLEAFGRHGSGNNYGVYAIGFGGSTAYGIYASATGGTTNWGGYFAGSVYTTGSYQSSDRKLKSDIRPLQNALQLIKALKPATYMYKTHEYEQMQLPEGHQFGLIADEVKQVLPSMVKQAIEPVHYENNDKAHGRRLSDEVTFEAVNYTAMIPVLIAAMQEQQALIDALQKTIETLEAKIK